MRLFFDTLSDRGVNKMIDQDELLAIGKALARTVRGRIPWSENMDAVYQGYKTSQMRKDREELLLSRHVRNYSMKQYDNKIDLQHAVASRALAHGVGYCGELCDVCVLLAAVCRSIKFHNESVYITKLHLPIPKVFWHDFCLIHQSFYIHNVAAGQFVAINLEGLMTQLKCVNACVVDPWIYTAKKCSDFAGLMARAKEFCVKSFYDGKVCVMDHRYSVAFSGQGIKQNLSRHIRPDVLNDTLKEFDTEYKMVREGYKKSGTYPEDIKLAEVRDQLRQALSQYNKGSFIQQRRRIKQLDDLKTFLKRLKSGMSFWYSSWPCSTTKEKIFAAMIARLDNYKKNSYPYVDNEWLKWTLLYACRLAFIVRGQKDEISKKLSFTTLNRTKTALALLSRTVVPHKQYKFESIEGMSLEHIRILRNSNKSERERYQRLYKLVYPNRDENDLIALYCQSGENLQFYAEVNYRLGLGLKLDAHASRSIDMSTTKHRDSMSRMSSLSSSDEHYI